MRILVPCCLREPKVDLPENDRDLQRNSYQADEMHPSRTRSTGESAMVIPTATQETGVCALLVLAIQ